MKNYFEIFGLQTKYDLDLEALEEKYFALQQQFHPDKASVAEIENSIITNKAYEVLKNPLRRALYLLKLNGLDIESDETAVRPDMATLEEVLEIQEKIPTLGENDILNLKKSLNKEINSDILAGISAIEKSDFKQAGQALVKAKYFNKILSDLKK